MKGNGSKQGREIHISPEGLNKRARKKKPSSTGGTEGAQRTERKN